MTGAPAATRSGRPHRRLIRAAVMALLAIAVVIVGRKLLSLVGSLHTLATFDRTYLVPIIALGCVYYVLKALRWHYYLRVAGISVPLTRSIAAYLAGQWFTFTPAGELMRAYLLNAGAHFALVAPTVVVQALVDFLSLALMATIMVPLYPALAPVVLPVTIPLLVTASMVALPPLRRYAAGWRAVQWLASGRRQQVMSQAARLLRPLPILAGVAMGVPTVLAGAGALYFAGAAVGSVRWTMTQANAVYSMMQLLGGLSPFPEDLGMTEGSGALLLAYLGFEPSDAVAAIVLFRASILGFSAVLGLLAFLALRRTVPELATTPVGGLRPGVMDAAAAAAE